MPSSTLVPRDQLLMQGAQLGVAQGRGKRDLRQRAVEPGEMCARNRPAAGRAPPSPRRPRRRTGRRGRRPRPWPLPRAHSCRSHRRCGTWGGKAQGCERPCLAPAQAEAQASSLDALFSLFPVMTLEAYLILESRAGLGPEPEQRGGQNDVSKPFDCVAGRHRGRAPSPA